ncbi:MAG: aldo/keto reductase [Actinobacteria bacterium RBG_16_64_13]|nr:MAG: aldo/keto reductase [Actinobacteria bacterium RBG_16_64_13]
MLYRPFGRTGEQVSALGFGAMRLPVVDGHRDRIDVPLATQMLHYAIENGVNYVDTAFPYHGAAFDAPGNSEPFLGKALAGGYRERVLLATKLPVWLTESRADMDRLLDGQLERLRTDHIDCYLLHGLNGKMWPKMAELGVAEFLEAAKADGRIRYAGFSYHDEAPAFAPIVDGYAWDFCQIQYNYMDVNFQAGAAGLAYAAEKGLAVIVMEPLKGGRLAGRAPADVQALWDTAPVARSHVEWALDFIWDDPRVSSLLSGMSDMEQVVENVELAGRGRVGLLSPEEHTLIGRVREAFRTRTAVDCTECRYCLPCPQKIEIPLVFLAVNNAALFEDLESERIGYDFGVKAGFTAPATACVECGQCEDACPQKIKIIEELAKAASILEE